MFRDRGGVGLAQVGYQHGRVQHQTQGLDAIRRRHGRGSRDDDSHRVLLFGSQRRGSPRPGSAGGCRGVIVVAQREKGMRRQRGAQGDEHTRGPMLHDPDPDVTVDEDLASASSGPDNGACKTSSRVLRAACNWVRICATSSSARATRISAPT